MVAVSLAWLLTLLYTRPNDRLIIDGPLTLSPACRRDGHCCVLMSRWPCLLFHFHRRSVFSIPDVLTL